MAKVRTNPDEIEETLPEEQEEEEYDYSDVTNDVDVIQKYKHVNEVERNWQHLEIEAVVIPGGKVRLHRPTRKEEILVRTQVRKNFRTEGIELDDIDVYSQNQTYIDRLLRICREDKGDAFEWLDVNPKNKAEAEAYDEVQGAILDWLLSYVDDE